MDLVRLYEMVELSEEKSKWKDNLFQIFSIFQASGTLILKANTIT